MDENLIRDGRRLMDEENAPEEIFRKSVGTYLEHYPAEGPFLLEEMIPLLTNDRARAVVREALGLPPNEED